MTFFLIFLLVMASAALVFLSYYAFQWRNIITRLEAEIAAQVERFDQEQKHRDEKSEVVKRQYQALASKYKDNAKQWSESSQGLINEIQRLAKWKNVADAEAKASEMTRNAEILLAKANADAANQISGAEQKASALLAEANQKAIALVASANEAAKNLTTEAKAKAKVLKDESQAILDSVTLQATRTIDAANKKAVEIAGSAYEAMKNSALYEQAMKSMKNVIDGYGNQYIIPPHSLLGDLAEDFIHAQAGRELKRAREYTKAMIRIGTAADCDYVEVNRRETAINFVLDAFNGKVDSVLSRVKHDNAGKLGQQIRDAFAIVNYNGKAFRDARIKEEYLAARLDELKWAGIVQHLASQERNEQREAKEQAREEARAAKELERALREAAKEETILQKAMEQAKEQIEHATGEQKAMYEARLQEMNLRLQEAMERKDRARSMAEQTKKGHVYIISNIGSFGDDMHKIGLTRRWDPQDRVTELGGASVPFGFDVHAMIVSDNAPELEKTLHQHFMLNQVNKVNHRKEFFRVSLKEIREEVEKLGLKGVSWTMTAGAKEYRESLATDKRIKEDPRTWHGISVTTLTGA